jgi:beta-lactamase superfamily II metal-dependent hydrolase
MNWSKSLLILGMLANALAGFAYLSFSRTGLHVWFFDVGQGDSAFIETPGHHQILIDGGPDDTVLRRLGGVMGPGDRSIDIVMISHPQADHIYGLVDVLKQYRVGEVLMTGVDGKTKLYRTFQATIKARHVPVLLVHSTIHIDFGDGAHFDSVWPVDKFDDAEVTDLNETCIVGKFSYEKHSVLFTGDITEKTEAQIDSQKFNLASDVLKEPHHGSKFGLLPAFLDKVHPKYDVISVGAHNLFGHPAPETLKKLQSAKVKILRTDKEGTIELSVRKGKMSIAPK